ncbi:AbrB family transcriptional regulator [Acidiferrobacter sp. SPIII_3]|jgi:AbrB family looped-hinge helix DNA binding protein|uniref:AbrB/MazE/SpoVT family DNA-binding domain-containing protein n=1 Tax=Acidiferrobacter sp. SPIII_3 TaxID=1281578 RepID=UPI000D72F7E8|nr:type II toxin-antitoxin system PrlF family antitoxin [Acidiferrobacter sp. SPIII_3]AWP23305.1 AbrB family transcriptional regulator [Acidiferrobacter sp. SPIII_3]
MSSATLTSKGQITIPKGIRDALRLGPGDRLDFFIQDDGRVLVQPATLKVTDLKGILYRKGARPVSVEEMRAAVIKRASDRKG